MRTSRSPLLYLLAAVPVLVAGFALWIWATIPPTPDPETLPSHVLEPPAAGYLGAVESGRTLTRELVAEEKLPGLSLAVAVDGEIVWAEGFRWADVEAETPVTPATVFRIGGVSKSITAAAVGLLVERGALDLDAPVQQYLPSFPEKEWPITTRQLMAHTAGIRDLSGEGEIFRRTSCADDAERLAIFAHDSLRFHPGMEYRYSSYGWVLVGAVVAAAAGEPYLDVVEREVLAPVGMDSTVADIAGFSQPDAVHFYFPRMALDPALGLQDAPETDLSCILPAGGFLSTPSDLVRLGSAMMDDRLLDPAIVEELQAPVLLATGEPSGRALVGAVERISMGAGGTPTRLFGHGLGDAVHRQPLSATAVGGHVTGGTSALVTIPEHGIAIAVTSNVSGAANVATIVMQLADTFVRARENHR